MKTKIILRASDGTRLNRSFNDYCNAVMLSAKSIADAISQDQLDQAYLNIIDLLTEREALHQQKE